MEEKHAPIKGWARVLRFIIPFFIVVGIFQVIGMKILGLSITPSTLVLRNATLE